MEADYHKTYKRFREHGDLSLYARWHFRNLGFNFRNRQTKQVLTKQLYFDEFGDQYLPDWELIPFEPRSGWENSEEKKWHFNEVTAEVQYFGNYIFRPIETAIFI